MRATRSTDEPTLASTDIRCADKTTCTASTPPVPFRAVIYARMHGMASLTGAVWWLRPCCCLAGVDRVLVELERDCQWSIVRVYTYDARGKPRLTSPCLAFVPPYRTTVSYHRAMPAGLRCQPSTPVFDHDPATPLLHLHLDLHTLRHGLRRRRFRHGLLSLATIASLAAL